MAGGDYKTLSLVSYVSLDLFCALAIVSIGCLAIYFWMKMRKPMNIWIFLSGTGFALTMISDVVWMINEYANFSKPVFYIANTTYFVMSILASFAWFTYTMKALAFKAWNRKLVVLLSALPAIVLAGVAITSPSHGLISSLNSFNQYVRGDMYFLYVIANYGYVALSGIMALVSFIVRRHLNKTRHSMALSLVLAATFTGAGAMAQVISGYNFASIGITISLSVYFAFLIFNNNREYLLSDAIRDRAERVIAGLSDDYVQIDYVTLEKEASNDHSTNFRSAAILKEKIPGWSEEDNFRQRLALIHRYFVIPEDRDEFYNQSRRPNILKELEKNKACSFRFRGDMGGEERYFQAKFVPDRKDGEIVGFIFGLRDIDSETRKELAYQTELQHTVSMRTMELREKNKHLNQMNESMIEMLGNVVEGRDESCGEHIRRVKGFTYLLGRQVMIDCPEYGLTQDDVDLIASASPLHDLGKVMIPETILNKPGKLTSEEFEIMKAHCQKGVDILKKSPKEWSDTYYKVSIDICWCHHEKWDGRGYPRGLKGDEIPISAQIVSIADIYDALTTERVYKKAISPDESFRMIMEGECGAFSSKILSCFEKVRYEFEKHSKDQNSTFGTASFTDLGRQSLINTSILIVDDSELDLEITADILTHEGAEVTMAHNGYEALEIVKKSEAYAFDAILMDLNLPDLDGMATTIAIRKLPVEWTNYVPILALTSLSGSDVSTRCAAAGMNSFLTKPVSVTLLTKELLNCIREQSKMIVAKLSSVEKRSGNDPLTGVNNISAYTDAVSSLSEELKKDSKIQFAIVEADLNNLKRVNDTYGHDIGDIYICNCAKILSECFKRSPVFRIGGDEFVVILRNADYQLRDKLMEKLRLMYHDAIKKSTIENGRVSFAAGIADYVSNVDETVGDVVKKADTSMYHNKRLMKLEDRKK